MNVNEPLPCLVCGHQPTPAIPDDDNTWQPYGATMFSAGSGHYGSTVWDRWGGDDRALVINICDACLTDRADRAAVRVTHPPVQRRVEFRPWSVGE